MQIIKHNNDSATDRNIPLVSGKNYSDIPYINYSSTDPDGDTITYQIYINGTLNISTTVNVTDWNASDGYYNLTVTANDGTVSSSNSSVVNFRLDTTNPQISFAGGTLNDSSRVWNNYIFANVTVTESHFKNITFSLRNSTATINTTTYTTQTYSINWTNLTGEDYWYNVTIRDTAGNKNSTSIRKITLIASESNITLNKGWNLISLTMKNTDNGTDRNITLVSGKNLIGYSADDPFNLENAVFTDSEGNNLTWTNAQNQFKLYGYMAYYDSSPVVAKNRKFKYVATSDLGMDDTNLRVGKGYELWTTEAGTLTLPAVGGTINATTYAWNKLRFSNGTDELNITDAAAVGTAWIDNTLQYWNPTKRGGADLDTISSGNLNAWQGYYIWSYYDNITLIRQN